MDFFDVIKKRRSIRRFTDDPVREEDLRAILDAARLAPSPYNRQPWHFIVIRDRELLSNIRDVINSIIDSQAETVSSQNKAHTSYDRKFNATNMLDAPVLIVALTHPWPTMETVEQPVFNAGLQSVAAAISQLHLAATALGYGGCWATLPLVLAREEIEAILEVEKPWFITALISIGVPAETPRAVRRKSIEEIVTFR